MELTPGYWGFFCKNADSFIFFIPWKGKIKKNDSIPVCNSVTDLPIVYRTVTIRQHSSFVFTSVQPSHPPDIQCRLWMLLFVFVGPWFSPINPSVLAQCAQYLYLPWSAITTKSFFRLWFNADYIYRHLKTQVLLFSSPAFPSSTCTHLSTIMTKKQEPIFYHDVVVSTFFVSDLFSADALSGFSVHYRPMPQWLLHSSVFLI